MEASARTCTRRQVKPMTWLSSCRSGTPCFFFDDQEVVDIKRISPQHVNRMLLQNARKTSWKKRAAKHECEGLMGGVWLEPIQALLTEKASEKWTETHRNVMRKLVVEGGCVRHRLYDIDWSDKEVCQGCQEEEGTEKHGTRLAGREEPSPRGAEKV